MASSLTLRLEPFTDSWIGRTRDRVCSPVFYTTACDHRWASDLKARDTCQNICNACAGVRLHQDRMADTSRRCTARISAPSEFISLCGRIAAVVAQMKCNVHPIPPYTRGDKVRGCSTSRKHNSHLLISHIAHYERIIVLDLIPHLLGMARSTRSTRGIRLPCHIPPA
jgi:hypothetical protein